MPLYEYRCTACGHVFEKIQSFSAPDEKACPKCGSPVERLISAPAIQFKGSGFYLTDYGKAGSGKSSASGEGKSESSGSEPASSGTGESGKGAPAAPSTPAASSSSGSGTSSGSSGSGGSSSAGTSSSPAKNS